MNGVKAPGGTMGLIGDEMQRNGLYGVGDGQCVGMIPCLHASVCASYLCHQSLFNDAIAVWPYSAVCYRTLCMRRYNRNYRLNL